MKGNIFHHLKLEIVLAIPAVIEWKMETNNSAAQGLAAKRILTTGVVKMMLIV